MSHKEARRRKNGRNENKREDAAMLGNRSNPVRFESDPSETLSPFALPRKPASQITGWDVPMGMDPDDLVLECDSSEE